MVLKIVQWNINCYQNNYSQLQILIQSKLPQIIARNSSKNSPTTINNPKKLQQSDWNRRGIATLIANNLEHKIINLQWNILALGIQIYLEVTFVVINIYIRPNEKISAEKLTKWIQNINKTMLFLGDFNAWSPIWSSSNYNERDRILSTTTILLC